MTPGADEEEHATRTAQTDLFLVYHFLCERKAVQLQ